MWKCYKKKKETKTELTNKIRRNRRYSDLKISKYTPHDILDDIEKTSTRSMDHKSKLQFSSPTCLKWKRKFVSFTPTLISQTRLLLLLNGDAVICTVIIEQRRVRSCDCTAIIVIENRWIIIARRRVYAILMPSSRRRGLRVYRYVHWRMYNGTPII